MDYIKQAKEQIMSMSPEKQEELMKELNSKLSSLRFIPNAGPQTEAYFSPADELLYGGSAGCVSGDTEFMTPEGWKRIDEYKDGDLVGMIDPTSMDLSFANPEAYIDAPCESMYHFISENLSMVLSGEHRCLLSIKGNLEVRMADAISPELSATIPVNFNHSDKDYQNNIEFAFRLSLNGKDRITVDTKLEADYIQFAAHLNNRIATIHKTDVDKYLVRIFKNKKVKIGTSNSRITTVKASRKYCFTLPTGFWLARHDDKIFITGNSGKSGLILGLAFTQHKRSLIMRRKYTDLDGLTEDAMRLFGDKCKLTGGSRPKIKTDDNRSIDFGAARHEGDEQSWQGVPHDLICYDELSQFTEYQYKYLQTWLRTVEKGQRTRIIGATNPPTSVEGEWVIKRWAAWLDPTHPNPAKPGELRWYVTDPDGKDIEVPDDKPVNFPGRPNPSLPKSRTFIPGKVADNPYLGSDYVATLDTLPEPLRSAMRDGNFMMSRKDVDWQTIPTAWVDDAIARWHKMQREARGTPMCAIGVDVCQAGGNDNAVLARRYDGWYDELITVPGSKLRTEDDITALILKHRRDGAEIIIDSSGGYGTHTFEQLKSNGIDAHKYIGKKNTDRRSVHGRFGFPNTRSAAYWLFREALDPSQPGGSQIALPSDMELRSELTAPTYELTSKGFKIENKEDVKDKLGRSPDKADAVVMAWWMGKKGLMSSHPSQVYGKMGLTKHQSKVRVITSDSKRTRRGR